MEIWRLATCGHGLHRCSICKQRFRYWGVFAGGLPSQNLWTCRLPAHRTMNSKLRRHSLERTPSPSPRYGISGKPTPLSCVVSFLFIITFRVSRRRCEMYCGYPRLCVCLSVCLSAAACLHYCTDPDVTWGSGRGWSIVVHYWVDLQSRHGLRCYGNITRTRNVSEYMLVFALCLVASCGWSSTSAVHRKRFLPNSTFTASIESTAGSLCVLPLILTLPQPSEI